MDVASELLLVIAASAALIIGALIQPLLRRLQMPYSVALLLIGLAVGLASRLPAAHDHRGPVVALVDYLTALDPHLILALFLPILIFQSALSFESHLFRKLLSPMLLLAIPGIVIATLVTALLCWWWLPYHWSWHEALLFGALISATDPVAVVALLRELGARAGLETVIEGESLLNDGTAIVLFLLVLDLFGPGVDWLLVPVQFGWVVAGGALFGGGIALILRQAMIHLADEPAAQVGLTIAAAYVTYLGAEALGLSGVVALVALGVILARRLRSALAKRPRQFLGDLWEFLAHSANTLIFLMVGLIIGARTPLTEATPWTALVLAYVAIHLARAVVMVVLWPWLKRQIDWLDWRNGVVLWWGGLRGAVGLVLALSLLHQQLSPATAEALLFLTAGIVLMTLLLNAPTMTPLLARLGLDQPSPERLAALAERRQQLHQGVAEALAAGSKPLGLLSADWQRLDEQLAPCWQPLRGAPTLPAVWLFEREQALYEQLHAEGWLSTPTLELLLAHLEDARDSADLDRTRFLMRHGQLLGAGWRAAVGRWWQRLRHRQPHQRVATAYGETLALARVQRRLLEEAPAELAAELRTNLAVIERRLGQWRRQFPELVASSETVLAGHLLLTRQLHRIEKWRDHGELTEAEARQLCRDAERRLALLPSMIAPSHLSLRAELHLWPALQSVDGVVLERVVAAGSRLWRNEGEMLGRQGEAATQMLLLLRGQAQLIERQGGSVTGVVLVDAGCRLGGATLLADQWLATTKAVTDLLLLAVPLTVVRRWQQQEPALWAALAALPTGLASASGSGDVGGSDPG